MAWRRGQAYGQDLRDWVLAAEGASVREIAERHSVSLSCAVKARVRESGEREARPQPSRLPLWLAPVLSALRTRAMWDATEAELWA